MSQDFIKHLSRRNFLSLLVGAVASGSLWGFFHWRESSVQDLLLELAETRGPETVNLGIRVLRQLKAEADQASLLAALERRLRTSDFELSRDSLGAVLQNVVVEDFCEGATIEIDGWLLSLTEARCYALAALTQRSSL